MKKIILFSTLLLLSLGAIAADYENGVHYRELAEQQPTSSSEKIEVLELFWYRCPHCFRLEEPLKVWLPTMPENAVFATMPAILGDSWEFHARVYYTFEALGLTDQFHEKLFNAIHKERKRLNTVEDVASWMQGLHERVRQSIQFKPPSRAGSSLPIPIDLPYPAPSHAR